MRLIRYFIFVIFNFAYKDGTRPENANPHLGVLMILMLYQSFLFLISLFFIDKYIITGFDAFIFKPVEGIVYGSGMMMYALLFPLNYYYFIKKKRLDIFYKEFRYAGINTKKNQRIGYVCWVLLFIVTLVFGSCMKHFFDS